MPKLSYHQQLDHLRDYEDKIQALGILLPNQTLDAYFREHYYECDEPDGKDGIYFALCWDIEVQPKGFRKINFKKEKALEEEFWRGIATNGNNSEITQQSLDSFKKRVKQAMQQMIPPKKSLNGD